MSEVNFRIVENYSHEDKFEDFKHDFLKGVPKKTLMEEYNITQSVWRDWRDRIKEHYIVDRRTTPIRKKAKSKSKNLDRNYLLKQTYKGNYSIIRMVANHRWSYGSYPNKECAIKIAERLVKCDWDRYVAYHYLQKYGVPNSVKILSTKLLNRENAPADIDEIYNDFKRDFLDGHTMNHLKNRYGLLQYQYRKLSERVRAEEGLRRKPQGASL